MLDRSVIDDKYSVLEQIPTIPVVEQLTWTTNIFVASDLTEYRQSLTDYPATLVTYNFNLRNVNRTLFTTILDKKSTWIIPYMPQMTRCGIVSDQAIPTTISGVDYPRAQYYLVFSRGHLVYRDASDMDVSTFDGIINATQAWVAPCHEAVIEPRLSWVDEGECRDGSNLSLSFRLAGDSEKALTYEYNEEFDFRDALQRGIEHFAARHQRNYAPPPSAVYTYQPRARMADEATTLDCRYLLEYDDVTREDYGFKGKFMTGKGAATADNYVEENKLHRLENDIITIEYQQGIAIATATMREVSA